MAKLCFYQGISNKYNSYTENGSLKEAVKKHAPDLDFEKCVMLKGGEKVEEDYTLQDEDIIFIRETPGAVACAVISIVVAAVALGAAIYSAVENKKQQKALEKAQRAANALAETPEQLPFLKGTQNRTAFGYNIPFIMGNVYFTPYKLTTGFYSLGLDKVETWYTLSGAALTKAIEDGYVTYKDTIAPPGTFFAGRTIREYTSHSDDYRVVSLLLAWGVQKRVYISALTTGEKQFWNCGLIAGFNDVLIQKIAIGDNKTVAANSTIEIPHLDGTTETVEYVAPDVTTNDYTKGVYYDENNLFEVRNNGELTMAGLSEKISSSSYTDQITHTYGDTTDYLKGVIKELEACTYKVDICVAFDGLRYYNSGWKSRNITFNVYYTTNASDDEPTWISAGTLVTGDVCAAKTVRFTKTIQFTAAQCYGKDISVKIVRFTPEMESNSQETAYLAYINCYQYDRQKSTSETLVPCAILEEPFRDKTTRIGLRMIANSSTQGSLDEVNVMAYGCARVWNGTEWSTDKIPTRNPASWVLEIMTSDIHAHSKYSDDEIDLESLGALFEYCEGQKYYCDGAITSDTKKSDVLNKILLECDATMYLSNSGIWTFAIEQAQENPVALLNEQSIKSVTVSKSFERNATVSKVSFTNRDSWAIDTFYMDKDGATTLEEVYGAEKLITETSTNYITTYDHAFKYAHRQMAKQTLQPREITVQIGHEGDYYPLYSKILLQMKQLSVGLSSGTITGMNTNDDGLILGFTTSDVMDFTDENRTYGIIIQSVTDSGRSLVYEQIFGEGKTKECTVTTGFIDPGAIAKGDIYSFGYIEDGEFITITNEMMITSAKANANGWELVLKDYNENIFKIDSIPEYKTNLTVKKDNSVSPVETVTESQIKAISIENTVDVAEAVAKDVAQEAADVVAHGMHFTSVHNIEDIPISLDDLQQRLDEVLNEAQNGISITDDKITIKVEDTEKDLRSMIEVTAESITSIVEDNDKAVRSFINETAESITSSVEELETELKGLINIQAGSVTALVEGGGAEGHMALSLELPATITETVRAKFITASSADEVNAVYAKQIISDTTTDFYIIKTSATSSAVKNLWEKAVKANLIASQIDLTATQIQLSAENVVITDETNKGQTIVSGGKIKTELIDVDELMAQTVTLKSNGLIKSSNFKSGANGFQIKANGEAEFYSGKFYGNLRADNLIFNELSEGTTDSGYLAVEYFKIDSWYIHSFSSSVRVISDGTLTLGLLNSSGASGWSITCYLRKVGGNPIEQGTITVSSSSLTLSVEKGDSIELRPTSGNTTFFNATVRIRTDLTDGTLSNIFLQNGVTNRFLG